MFLYVNWHTFTDLSKEKPFSKFRAKQSKKNSRAEICQYIL
jgi:hypothetical protein